MSPRLSAGMVVVRRAPRGYRFLILRAYRNWDFPKGGLEPGEEPLDCARREVAEETGLTRLALPWGEAFIETGPYARGKVARYYLALTDEEVTHLPINPALGRPEHHEFRWVEAARARMLLPPRLQPVLTWAQERLDAPQAPAKE